MAVSLAPYLSAHDLSVLIDFLLFGATLAGVAVFHRHTLAAALIGLGVILIALSLRPVARDARALATDARRLANLAERELAAAMRRAPELNTPPEEAAAPSPAPMRPVQSPDTREDERIA